MKKLLIAFLAVLTIAPAALADEWYTVKRGDCLSRIGSQNQVSWRQIAQLNKIRSPYIIYPGQKLLLKNSAPIAQAPAKVEQTTAESKPVQMAAVPEKKPEVTAEQEQPIVQSAKLRATVTQVKQQTVFATEQTVTTDTMPVIQQQSQIAGPKDKTDLIVGYGHIFNMDSNSHAEGNFAYFSGRYRPYFYTGKEYDFGAGGFVAGNWADGTGYNKKTLSAGPTAKLYGGGWDSTLDVGLGHRWDSLYGYPDERIWGFNPRLWFSDYDRQLNNYKFFAKKELGVSAFIPFDNSGRDKREFSAKGILWIYDFRPKENSKDINISFGIGTGPSYTDSKWSWAVGPMIGLRYFEQDAAVLSFDFKRKLANPGGWLFIPAISVNVGNTYSAVKGFGIEYAKAEDLRVAKAD